MKTQNENSVLKDYPVTSNHNFQSGSNLIENKVISQTTVKEHRDKSMIHTLNMM